MPEGGVSNLMALITQVSANANIQLPKQLVEELLEGMFAKQLQQSQNLQQALIKQMEIKKAQQAARAKQMAAQGGNTAQAGTTTADAAKASEPSSALMSDADIQTQAKAQAERQIAHLLKSGALTMQESSYQVKLNFTQGRLLVNDKPYTPAMLK